jgi:hypothetical protein
VVVVRPVGDASDRCSSPEILCLREQRELGDESTIASTVKTDALRLDSIVRYFEAST